MHQPRRFSPSYRSLLYNTAVTYHTLFFDLDETLYPPGNGLWHAISARMNEYMVQRLGLPSDRVPDLRHSYYETYGTTLRGLQANHQVDAQDFLRFVHDLPLAELLQPDPELRPLLLSLPQTKWICTNADRAHAERVVRFLGIADCFRGVIDIWAADFEPKPAAAFYQRALEIAGVNNPQGCVILDDLPRNLAPARAMGFTTVLVRPNVASDPAANYAIPDLHSLPGAFPELWQGWRPGEGKSAPNMDENGT
jgi:putative hydrolase of the HAD superfamily